MFILIFAIKLNNFFKILIYWPDLIIIYLFIYLV